MVVIKFAILTQRPQSFSQRKKQSFAKLCEILCFLFALKIAIKAFIFNLETQKIKSIFATN